MSFHPQGYNFSSFYFILGKFKLQGIGGEDGKYVIDTSILEILDPSSQYLSDVFFL